MFPVFALGLFPQNRTLVASHWTGIPHGTESEMERLVARRWRMWYDYCSLALSVVYNIILSVIWI